jgi:hypothetical protein
MGKTVFEITVLRKIFGNMKAEVGLSEAFRLLNCMHNEKLRDVYASPCVISVVKCTEDMMGCACSFDGRTGNA